MITRARRSDKQYAPQVNLEGKTGGREQQKEMATGAKMSPKRATTGELMTGTSPHQRGWRQLTDETERQGARHRRRQRQVKGARKDNTSPGLEGAVAQTRKLESQRAQGRQQEGWQTGQGKRGDQGTRWEGVVVATETELLNKWDEKKTGDDDVWDDGSGAKQASSGRRGGRRGKNRTKQGRTERKRWETSGRRR